MIGELQASEPSWTELGLELLIDECQDYHLFRDQSERVSLVGANPYEYLVASFHFTNEMHDALSQDQRSALWVMLCRRIMSMLLLHCKDSTQVDSLSSQSFGSPQSPVRSTCTSDPDLITDSVYIITKQVLTLTARIIEFHGLDIDHSTVSDSSEVENFNELYSAIAALGRCLEQEPFSDLRMQPVDSESNLDVYFVTKQDKLHYVIRSHVLLALEALFCLLKFHMKDLDALSLLLDSITLPLQKLVSHCVSNATKEVTVVVTALEKVFVMLWTFYKKNAHKEILQNAPIIEKLSSIFVQQLLLLSHKKLLSNGVAFTSLLVEQLGLFLKLIQTLPLSNPSTELIEKCLISNADMIRPILKDNSLTSDVQMPEYLKSVDCKTTPTVQKKRRRTTKSKEQELPTTPTKKIIAQVCPNSEPIVSIKTGIRRGRLSLRLSNDVQPTEESDSEHEKKVPIKSQPRKRLFSNDTTASSNKEETSKRSSRGKLIESIPPPNPIDFEDSAQFVLISPQESKNPAKKPKLLTQHQIERMSEQK
ncbi:hypothetical protein Ciccas_001175 [Cichlidogyrus casuarinus]|uniref:Uncharacterized protein n=1 Tax=Cichlidogyrus casuarinus TaxID=1844966 RepID=A0ABD2QL20_9PLAT